MIQQLPAAEGNRREFIRTVHSNEIKVFYPVNLRTALDRSVLTYVYDINVLTFKHFTQGIEIRRKLSN